MYSLNEIKTMIYEYRWRKNVLIQQGFDIDSITTSQYGIDATMPKAQGSVGDIVGNTVVNNNKVQRMYKKNINTVSFIDEYEQYIDNDKNYQILQYIKDNYKKSVIQDTFEIGQTNLDNRVNDIVNILYQHQYKQ